MSIHTGPIVPQGVEGYGQLSISSSPVEIISNGGAAGVWALIGGPAAVDQAKAGKPQGSAAVVAHSTDGHAAIVADSVAGVGISATSHIASAAAISGSNPNGLAGSFNGNVVVTGSLTSSGAATVGTLAAKADVSVGGNVTVNGGMTVAGVINIGTAGDVQFADCAEQFDLLASEAEPGTVMVIGDAEKLSPCDRAYDTRVAGVVSGAERYRPALVLDQRETGSPRCPVALIGKVFCKVDAAYGPIAVGDLLTTSPTPGHAMRAADPQRAFGTTIGKALRGCSGGTGLIPVLVALS